jgi:hypothetical protein
MPKWDPLPFLTALLFTVGCAGGSKALVYIPAGTYIIGCSSPAMCGNNLKRTASLVGYWIDRSRVILLEYLKCTANRGCPPDRSTSLLNEEILVTSIEDASSYCSWKGGRLPSADEWEVAASGGDQRSYPWGDRFDNGLLLHPHRRRVSRDLWVEYYTRQSLNQADSPFGVSEMVGGPPQFAIGSHGVQLRGGVSVSDSLLPPDLRQESPSGYAIRRVLAASPSARASFRCVYDQPPSR